MANEQQQGLGSVILGISNQLLANQREQKKLALQRQQSAQQWEMQQQNLKLAESNFKMKEEQFAMQQEQFEFNRQRQATADAQSAEKFDIFKEKATLDKHVTFKTMDIRERELALKEQGGGAKGLSMSERFRLRETAAEDYHGKQIATSITSIPGWSTIGVGEPTLGGIKRLAARRDKTAQTLASVPFAPMAGSPEAARHAELQAEVKQIDKFLGDLESSQSFQTAVRDRGMGKLPKGVMAEYMQKLAPVSPEAAMKMEQDFERDVSGQYDIEATRSQFESAMQSFANNDQSKLQLWAQSNVTVNGVPNRDNAARVRNYLITEGGLSKERADQLLTNALRKASK